MKHAARLEELIRGRRSVRRFATTPVPDSVVRQLVELALYSPSPHNSQPWRFTMLGPESRRRLAEAMGKEMRRDMEASGEDPEVSDRRARRSEKRIGDAPGAIVISTVDQGLAITGGRSHDDLERTMAVQSVGCALQTLFLAAWARGLGCCWMAAPMYCPEIVRWTLELPRDMHPQALVLIGHPQGDGAHRERLAVEAVLSRR